MWKVIVECEHGVRHRVAIDLGCIQTPKACECGTCRPKPSRLRLWLEARRLRKWLDELGREA